MSSSLPAYTTVQTTVYRTEAKKVRRRTKKIATALIFEAAVTREAAELHLIDSGTLSLQDVRATEKTLLKLSEEEKAQ